MLEQNSDPCVNFYLGAAYGYKALHRFRQHNWIAEALNAQNQLDKAFELTTSALAQSKKRNKDDELENSIDHFDEIKND